MLRACVGVTFVLFNFSFCRQWAGGSREEGLPSLV